MTKTTAPHKTRSPAVPAAPLKAAGSKSRSPSLEFIMAAMDMSWRLAVVVLVPIIGGFEIDQRVHTTPLLTILGFLLAMGGMALVLKRMLVEVSQSSNPKPGKQL